MSSAGVSPEVERDGIMAEEHKSRISAILALLKPTAQPIVVKADGATVSISGNDTGALVSQNNSKTIVDASNVTTEAAPRLNAVKSKLDELRRKRQLRKFESTSHVPQEPTALPDSSVSGSEDGVPLQKKRKVCIGHPSTQLDSQSTGDQEIRQGAPQQAERSFFAELLRKTVDTQAETISMPTKSSDVDINDSVVAGFDENSALGQTLQVSALPGDYTVDRAKDPSSNLAGKPPKQKPVDTGTKSQPPSLLTSSSGDSAAEDEVGGVAVPTGESTPPPESSIFCADCGSIKHITVNHDIATFLDPSVKSARKKAKSHITSDPFPFICTRCGEKSHTLKKCTQPAVSAKSKPTHKTPKKTKATHLIVPSDVSPLQSLGKEPPQTKDFGTQRGSNSSFKAKGSTPLNDQSFFNNPAESQARIPAIEIDDKDPDVFESDELVCLVCGSHGHTATNCAVGVPQVEVANGRADMSAYKTEYPVCCFCNMKGHTMDQCLDGGVTACGLCGINGGFHASSCEGNPALRRKDCSDEDGEPSQLRCLQCGLGAGLHSSSCQHARKESRHAMDCPLGVNLGEEDRIHRQRQQTQRRAMSTGKLGVDPYEVQPICNLCGEDDYMHFYTCPLITPKDPLEVRNEKQKTAGDKRRDRTAIRLGVEPFAVPEKCSHCGKQKFRHEKHCVLHELNIKKAISSFASDTQPSVVNIADPPASKVQARKRLRTAHALGVPLTAVSSICAICAKGKWKHAPSCRGIPPPLKKGTVAMKLPPEETMRRASTARILGVSESQIVAVCPHCHRDSYLHYGYCPILDIDVPKRKKK